MRHRLSEWPVRFAVMEKSDEECEEIAGATRRTHGLNLSGRLLPTSRRLGSPRGGYESAVEHRDRILR